MNIDNPFDLFNLKPQIHVNHAELDNAFQRIQLLCHPDKQTDSIAKQAAVTLSTKVSTLYIELKTPLGCINTILKFHALDTVEHLAKTTQDMETMQEVFALQEELMDLKSSDDSAGIKQLGDMLQERITDTESAFMLAHKNNNANDLKQQAVRFSYLSKFQKSIL